MQHVSRIISNIRSIFHRIDPAHDCLIDTLQVTIPGLVGAFLWFYLVNPFTIEIVLIPAASLMIPCLFPKLKDKLLNFAALFAFLAVVQMVAAVFSHRPAAMLILSMLVIFPCVSSRRFRYSCIFALGYLSVYFAFPGGWHNGINRIIEILLMAVIVFGCLFVYDYVFSRIRMRSNLIYLLELLMDTLNCVISPGNLACVVNRHLFSLPLSFKPDFEVEKIFKAPIDRLFHRVYIRIVRAGRIILDEEYYFRRNKDYQAFSKSIFIQCRRIFRDITFMNNFSTAGESISNLIQETDDVIMCIHNCLVGAMKTVSGENNNGPRLDDELLDKWLAAYTEIRTSGVNQLSDMTIESMYGLKCLIEDTRQLASILERGAV